MPRRPDQSRRNRVTTVAGGLLSAVVLAQLTLAAPAAAVPGLIRQSSTGPSNSLAKTQNQSCPAGSVLLGGGGIVTGASGQVGMDIMLPLSGNTAFSVTGREDATGTSANWLLTSAVVCAPAPAGYTVVSGSSAWMSSSTNWHTVSCPIGTVAIGVGGAVNGAGNSELILEDLRINGTSVTVAGAEDETGFDSNWQVQARAICATQPAGYEVRLDDSAYDSATSKSINVSCTSGKKVHGVGAEIVGGDGQVRLTAVFASSDTTVTVSAVEDETGFSSNWKVRAYATCAN
ncbi:hypothetical protein [Micromonospora echinofusca]|uniref:Uncharacterized protein n=1 Tax=Micromonospora echinofusca TaxID=47858 RepID=A0ABS3VJ80_MICEH|nr:hypothetical protein [Micromonospora echinofusca]MBO4204531.1 hypothetical protein [Micromonospora echinofusca]